MGWGRGPAKRRSTLPSLTSCACRPVGHYEEVELTGEQCETPGPERRSPLLWSCCVKARGTMARYWLSSFLTGLRA